MSLRELARHTCVKHATLRRDWDCRRHCEGGVAVRILTALASRGGRPAGESRMWCKGRSSVVVVEVESEGDIRQDGVALSDRGRGG